MRTFTTDGGETSDQWIEITRGSESEAGKYYTICEMPGWTDAMTSMYLDHDEHDANVPREVKDAVMTLGQVDTKRQRRRQRIREGLRDLSPSSHVLEVFSPPRICPVLSRAGLRPSSPRR